MSMYDEITLLETKHRKPCIEYSVTYVDKNNEMIADTICAKSLKELAEILLNKGAKYAIEVFTPIETRNSIYRATTVREYINKLKGW